MRTLLGTALLLCSGCALACADELRDVEGYTVISVTQVDGDFEGCDFDKRIRFADGTTLKCSSYSYSYAYMPDAVIFGKRVSHQGRSFLMVKVLIDDEMYDMDPQVLRE